MASAGLTRDELLRRIGAAGLLASGLGVPALVAEDALGTPSAGKSRHVRHFFSRPDLRPPAVTVRHAAERTADGLLFLAPSSGPGQHGPLIMDDRGEVVWFHPTQKTAMNFRPAIYHGKPVLTWWEGKAPRGLGRGDCLIADQSYRVIARFRSAGGVPVDLHDFLLTPRGTALVTLNEHARGDLTPIGGRSGAPVIGGVVQELSIPSGRVLWEWRSLDHVAIEESHLPRARPYDYFHINSVDVDGQGNLLVSARNTWAIYKISRETGRVIWRLGGKRSDFRMGKGTVTAWQHDARFHDSGRAITLFDNGAAPQVSTQSRALVVGLDVERKRAFLLRRYTHHPGRIVTPFMGSAQLLPNGNMLVGWGGRPWLTEFGSDGSIRFDAKLPPGGQNYRAFRFPWVGRPSEPPTLVSRRAPGRRTLYASWNGATEVAAWELRAGVRRGALRPAGRTEKRRFETALEPPKGSRFAAVGALDRSGRPLATSKTIRV